MAEPQVQYAKTSDGVNIAFASMGEGPPLVRLMSPGFAHVQRDWTTFPGALQPLARTFRVIWYDPRGSGLSDRDEIDFSMEAMMRDLEAVIERTGLESFAVLAQAGSVPVAVTYAAAFPDRVSHLIFIDGWANLSDFAGTPAFEALGTLIDSDWTLFTETLARVLIGFDLGIAGEYIRACIEPEAYRAWFAAAKSYDVSALLPDLKAKTLVLHNNDGRVIPVRAGQKLAARIPDARFLGMDDWSLERVAALVEEFIGTTDKPESVEPGAFRTILFTDMESSTSLRRQLGDSRVQELVRTHNAIVRDSLKANSGNEIKHTGDGIMASFSTATSALQCAIAIQQGVAAHAEEHPDVPLGVYIGLNAGEPIAEEQDLFGTSVDLARRICEHAQPGQILASNVVRELAEGKGFLFGDIGDVVPKGFEQPVRLYEVRWREEG